jgi:hypothetical protein
MIKLTKSFILLPVVLILFSSPSFATIQRDVNGNGKLDLADALICLQTTAGLRNVAGEPDLADAVFIIKTLAGLRPIEEEATVEVSVSGPNSSPYNAATAAVVFLIHPTNTFTYNIVGFAAGDRLVFDVNTAVGLANSSGTDGELEITGSLNLRVATINLTGIAPASDAAIYGANSFNTVFGAGSLVPVKK